MIKLTAQYLRDAVAAKKSLRSMAAETGASHAKIWRLCKANGIVLPGRSGRPRKLPLNAEIIARLQAGERPSAIARAFGAHESSVHVSLYRGGLRLEGGRVLATLQRSHLVPMIAALKCGTDIGVIAASIGTSIEAIEIFLANEGFLLVGDVVEIDCAVHEDRLDQHFAERREILVQVDRYIASKRAVA